MLDIRVRISVWKDKLCAHLWCYYDGSVLLSLFLHVFLPE